MAIGLRPGKHTSARVKARLRRQVRTRKKVHGTPERPRLVVTRTSRHMVAQVVDDLRGHTLVSASTMEADLRSLEGDKRLVFRRHGAAVPTLKLSRKVPRCVGPVRTQREDRPT